MKVESNQFNNYHVIEKAESKRVALALTTLSIVMLALSCILWGIGTSPGMMLTGVNFVPYLAGVFFAAVNVGIVAAAAGFVLKTLYHDYRLKPVA